MYLKSVDLYGFKSFANKMVFKFDKGITGIVGPNGSGKSNIADAVRWVLGEQSAKQLRGSKMEDVIFAGTETRKPLGYCQVDLTIDNQDKKMPIDYSEVTVSRRVYRSGESGYYINGTACRLRDVHELFMDTGVGREGYSIIGQGQVDKILSTKPDDRRALFDEAAGIVKYKTRKEAAIKKLTRSEQDLERVEDIITELEGQKETLEEQAETARIYLDKREELKKLEVTSFIRLIDEFDKKLEDLKEKETIATDDLNNKKQIYKDLARKHHEYEELFNVVEEELEKNREAITETSLEVEKFQSSLTLSEEKIKNYENQKAKLDEEIERLQDSEINRTQELNTLKDGRLKQTRLVGEKQALIKERQETLDSMQAEIDEKEKEIDEIQTNMIQRLNEVSGIKSQVHRNELILENNSHRIDHLKSRSTILKKTNSDLEKEIEGNKDQVEAFELKQKELLDEKMKIRKTINGLEENQAKDKEELNQKRHQVNKDRSRLEALKDMEDQYEGYFFSVKKIMELKDPGALGVIAELISVEEKFEKAIEIALGSNLQNIVTTDEGKAKYFIDYLKKNKFGRGTFLPMTTVKGSAITGINESDGYIGVASELIDCDEKFKPIIRQLLGRILIVEDLNHGIRLAKLNGQRYRIITLDGDVISPGGAMSGGAFKKEKGQLLSRKNEIESLEVTIDKGSEIVDVLAKKVSETDETVLALKEEIESIRVKEQDINIELHTVTTLLNANMSELSKFKQELLNIEAEFNQLESTNNDLSDTMTQLKHNLDSTETDHTDAEEKVKEIGEYIQVLKEDKDIVLEEITSDKMELSSLMQSAEHMDENILRLSESLQSKTDSISGIREEINQTELLILKERHLLTSNKEEQVKAKEKLNDLNEELNDLRYKRQDIQVSKGQLDSKKDFAQEEANALEKELIRITGSVEKLEIQKENQINYMWDEYELTYTSAQEFKTDIDLTEPAIKQKVTRLKSEMKQLGDVNVHAIEEFRQVKERYTFLTEQRDDLEAAKQKLLDIITELDKQMTEQFREKFELIRITFSKVFKELFGGGKGLLELTDTDNVLESGITIVAQPPGKKLQNMMLLSGGERAFTAIALLFAIQSLRPSPFVVLDEIEAALDDANVDRFAEYLNKLTDQTQFIVITHRKGTMEAADALYGITMQEKGVSTQVSVKLIQDQLGQPAS